MTDPGFYSRELTEIGAYGLRYCFTEGFDDNFFEIWPAPAPSGKPDVHFGPLDIVSISRNTPERVAKRVLWGTVYGWERWMENNNLGRKADR